MANHFSSYANRLASALRERQWDDVEQLASGILEAWQEDRQVFLIGNGGSAANAIHLANDFLYGVGAGERSGIKVEALPANSAVLTCLANDVEYKEIFSTQLVTKAAGGDLLLALSGSGNSPNIVRALEVALERKMMTYAIVGYDGGLCKKLARSVIHLPVDDMQLSEDFQLIVGHMCMQWLNQRGSSITKDNT